MMDIYSILAIIGVCIHMYEKNIQKKYLLFPENVLYYDKIIFSFTFKVSAQTKGGDLHEV